MITKLAIGTVQFGMNYGISNTEGQVPTDAIARILRTAASAGIDTLDTAHAYGSSEVVLGNSDISQFRVITKLPPGTRSFEAAQLAVEESIDRLKLSPRGLMLHHFKDFGEGGLKWSDFCAIQQKFKVEKIGFSLYDPAEWYQLREADIKPGIIQVPYNIFDRRFENVMAEAKRAGTEVHVRSAFLQGLFFRELASLPEHFNPARRALEKVRTTAQENNIDLAAGLLGFATANQNVSRVVIGVTNMAQLKHNIDELKKQNCHLQDLIPSDTFSNLPLSVINPALWKI